MRTSVAAVGGAKQGRAHSLATASFRPSQPIDILGKARHRSSEVVQKMPMPIVPQQNGQQQQNHQPRVIQPRRLNNNNASPSAASLGPMRGNGNGREVRKWAVGNIQYHPFKYLGHSFDYN
jgi:hypothetical protein